MATAAKRKGVSILGITDHGPGLTKMPTEDYFRNFKVIDRNYFGIRLLLGIEANITGVNGELDVSIGALAEMDIVVASLHWQCFRSGSREYNTSAVIEAIKNPRVTILGHPDDGKYPVDYKAVVQAAKANDVLIEINNASLTTDSFRLNGPVNSREILSLCRQYGSPVIMSSDAHFEGEVGNHSLALALIQETGFPEELVINDSIEKLERYLVKNQCKDLRRAD
jgi:putative hydrolase